MNIKENTIIILDFVHDLFLVIVLVKFNRV